MIWKFYKKAVNYFKGELCYYYERYILYNYRYRDANNLNPFDSSPEAIQRDVDRAEIIARSWLDLLSSEGGSLKGKKILEIGPGTNFGAILLFACHGAEVMVADRFLTPWDQDYHPKFYELLMKNYAKRWPSIDLSPLDRVISQGAYPPKIISLFSCSLENIWEVPDNTLDVVVSHAVIEHIYNLKKAFHQLFRITKPGGMGIHMVDFRDHRDFSRPLEYLLMRDDEFYGKFKAELGECGNRCRPLEMQKMLESAGFEIKEFLPHIFTDEEYLAKLLKRLRQARKSRYCDFPGEELRDLVGRFLVVKKEVGQ
jgi:SAM-dependent methyltransferase